MKKNIENNEVHPANRAGKITLIGILVNFILAVIKASAGIIGNSFALIADAIESTLDIFTSVIVWSSLKIAAKPPDETHPFGHGKAEPLATMIVASALFLAAIGIAVESILEIINPHEGPAPFTLVVLVAVVLVKETLFRFVYNIGNQVESNLVKADAWHHRSDAITSGAAFIGIFIAVIFGEGFEAADDWAALFVSFIITYNSYKIFVPALKEIMDTAPPESIKEKIKNDAIKVKGVIALDKCYVRKMGFDYYVELQIIVDGNISVHSGHDIAHQVKDLIRLKNPRVANVTIHVEPHDK